MIHKEKWLEEISCVGQLIAAGLEIGKGEVAESGSCWLEKAKRKRSLLPHSTSVRYKASAPGFLLIGYYGGYDRAFYSLKERIAGMPSYTRYVTAISSLINVRSEIISAVADANIHFGLSTPEIVEMMKNSPARILEFGILSVPNL